MTMYREANAPGRATHRLKSFVTALRELFRCALGQPMLPLPVVDPNKCMNSVISLF